MVLNDNRQGALRELPVQGISDDDGMFLFVLSPCTRPENVGAPVSSSPESVPIPPKNFALQKKSEKRHHLSYV